MHSARTLVLLPILWCADPHSAVRLCLQLAEQRVLPKACKRMQDAAAVGSCTFQVSPSQVLPTGVILAACKSRHPVPMQI